MCRIFLSHRHDDRIIGDRICKHLLYWGIPEHSIYQSPSVSSGFKIGAPIPKELTRVLAEAGLVIL
jgi:hypothetical protein